MRLAAALSLLALSLLALSLSRAAADPVCGGVAVTAGGKTYGSPFCAEAPLPTHCGFEEVEAVGTGLSALAVVCLPVV